MVEFSKKTLKFSLHDHASAHPDNLFPVCLYIVKTQKILAETKKKKHMCYVEESISCTSLLEWSRLTAPLAYT
jgi:hypothetical protein